MISAVMAASVNTSPTVLRSFSTGFDSGNCAGADAAIGSVAAGGTAPAASTGVGAGVCCKVFDRGPDAIGRGAGAVGALEAAGGRSSHDPSGIASQPLLLTGTPAIGFRTKSSRSAAV